MQFIIKTLVAAAIFASPLIATAQSTYLPQGHKHQQFLNRMEIKLQRNPDFNVTTVKPLSRRLAVAGVEAADSLFQAGELPLTNVDQYNMRSFLMNNPEWVTGDKSEFASKRSLWNTFYKTKAHLLEVDEKDFFLAVNPLYSGQISSESDNNGDRVFLNSKGVNVRGLIANRIGFSAYITDNQERGPSFVQERVNQFLAVPGAGFYKPFKTTGTDYIDARGSINFGVTKYIDVQFGYDKNFIGNGYRSLFLSDFANNYLFLKLNTRIWKINYQNIFMELTPQFKNAAGSSNLLLDKKYAAMHHLSMNVTKWLNVGLFDAVVFGRRNKFDFLYLNPIIFLRAAEQQNGSPDNAILGFDFKANVAKRFQFYGQLMLDEFYLKEIRDGNGWWANKWGVQLGGKYIDALGVKNLDLQGEVNVVRPFSYSHTDSTANYTHYNQPMAHPLGANFLEATGIIRYQPTPKLQTSARLILWRQGIDTGNSNIGVNIFKVNTTRSGEYGFDLPSGEPVNGVNFQFLVSYEIKENIFLEASALIRSLKTVNINTINRNTSVITAGIRMNMFRREYDY
jgi:hypothetical protein